MTLATTLIVRPFQESRETRGTWDSSFRVLLVAETSHPASGSYTHTHTHTFIHLSRLSLSLSIKFRAPHVVCVLCIHRYSSHINITYTPSDRIRSPSSAPPHSIPPILYNIIPFFLFTFSPPHSAFVSFDLADDGWIILPKKDPSYPRKKKFWNQNGKEFPVISSCAESFSFFFDMGKHTHTHTERKEAKYIFI